MARLDCCEARAYVVHRCRIVDGQPTGTPTVTELTGIAELCWSRVLDDTGEATVAALIGGDANEPCCDALDDVRTWAHELMIQRCGELVWQGPIVELTYRGDAVLIEARDVTAWLDVRVVRDPIDFTADSGTGPVDLAVIAEAVIRSALEPDDPCLLEFLQIEPTGVDGELEVAANTEYAGDVLRQLARTGLDFTAVGRRIWVGPDMGAVPIASLRDEHFLADIEVREDGLEAGTRWIVNGDGVSCVRGGVDPFWGLIEQIAEEDGITDTDTACRAAESRLAATNPPPLFVEVPRNAALSPEAPVTIDQLVPGQMVNVDVARLCRRVNQTLRLAAIEVCYDDDGETVAVRLAPVGTLGGTETGGD